MSISAMTRAGVPAGAALGAALALALAVPGAQARQADAGQGAALQPAAADAVQEAAGHTRVRPARPAQRVRVGDFEIDETEVTIASFREYAQATGLVTEAERAGGGHEWGAGWERRAGWTVYRPYGREPASADEPAVHLTWHEASGYCAWRAGRLPTVRQWQAAAYTETREQPAEGFESGRSYRYPVGDAPAGMNTSAADDWPRHAAAGSTARGVNGLFDMGGNVWEWIADRRGDQALTAGGSWWYGPDKATADAMQWKPAGFHAVYVGLRCVYAPAPAG